MSFIYHLKPEPMVGTSLIPLNMMDSRSELYRSHANKYIGREDLMKAVIPKLNCKWNDVIQFSALDPKIILNKIKNFDKNISLIRREYFKVHIDQILSKYEVAIFQRAKKPAKGDFTIYEEDIVLMNQQNYVELFDVPEETLEYWNWAIENNEKLLWFAGITHILVKGCIDTKEFNTSYLENINE